LALLCCDLSLITIHISDYWHFSDMTFIFHKVVQRNRSGTVGHLHMRLFQIYR